MSTINKLPSARRDLVDIFYRYVRDGTFPTARRFLAQAEATVQQLAAMPGMGTRYQPDEPRYADLLHFPVSRFRMYLVFYRSAPGGIEVLRVLHGARDIHTILAEEFDIEEHGGDDREQSEDE